MSLLSLPTEILHEIIGILTPEFYNDIALTCKTTHGASLHYRKDYNARRKRFRHFSYDSAHALEGANDREQASSTGRDGDYPPVRNALELRQVIAEAPSIGRYIQTADFSGDNLGVMTDDEFWCCAERAATPSPRRSDGSAQTTACLAISTCRP